MTATATPSGTGSSGNSRAFCAGTSARTTCSGASEATSSRPSWPRPDETWAAEKAAELSAALDRAYGAEEKNWHLSASIGVSFAPRQGDGFDGLYRAADAALYKSKERGKNGYTISDGACGRD